jgi:anthranilate 1,2-dioxygenase large subunit
VAHQAEILNPGDFKTWYLGETPILISHGQDGKFRAFINACTHRGTPLELVRYDNRSTFHCPYHRWAFAFDGSLKHCPGKEDFPSDFRTEDYGLRQLKIYLFYGIIFVSAHEKPIDFDEFIGDIADPVKSSMRHDGRLTMLGAQRVRFRCNWKYYTDNGNDGYHAAQLHSAFRLLNWQGGKGYHITTPWGHSAFEYETSAYQDNGFLQDPSVVEKRKPKSIGNRVGMIAPATIFSDHLDTLMLRFLRPLGPHHVEVDYTYFAHADEDPDYIQHRIRQSGNLLGPCGFISLEDGAVFDMLEYSTRSPVPATFLRGVGKIDPSHGTQHDEAGGPWYWGAYRKLMGFKG